MENNILIITQGIKALFNFSKQCDQRGIEPVRVARVGWALLFAGCGYSKFFKNISDYLKQTQQNDGGLSDIEETVWSASFLAKINGDNDPSVISAVNWIKSEHYEQGGWGKHKRDRLRIPTTSLVTTLLPSIATKTDYNWVKKEWESDLSGPVQLSYKAGFYLLTEAGHQEPDENLIKKTITYLTKDQNQDGGFGPWRNHPVGSDPWSTGIVLWGLSQWIRMVNKNVVIKMFKWLQRNQLTTGYWPYHYLDDGTSYALIGAVAASRALKEDKSHV